MITRRSINPVINTPFQPRFAGSVGNTVAMSYPIDHVNDPLPPFYYPLRASIERIIQDGHDELTRMVTGDNVVSFRLVASPQAHLEVNVSDTPHQKTLLAASSNQPEVEVEDRVGATSLARLFLVSGSNPPTLLGKPGGTVYGSSAELTLDHLKQVIGQLLGRVSQMKLHHTPSDVKTPFVFTA